MPKHAGDFSLKKACLHYAIYESSKEVLKALHKRRGRKSKKCICQSDYSLTMDNAPDVIGDGVAYQPTIIAV